MSSARNQPAVWTLLRRADQPAAAVLLAVAAALVVGRWLLWGGHRGELIEIDHDPAFVASRASAGWHPAPPVAAPPGREPPAPPYPTVPPIPLADVAPGGVAPVDVAPGDVAVKAEPGALAYLVDVNTATWPELVALPGIGETLARRIVESRARDGPFASVDDLRRVRGIGAKTLEKLRPHLAARSAAAVASTRGVGGP